MRAKRTDAAHPTASPHHNTVWYHVGAFLLYLLLSLVLTYPLVRDLRTALAGGSGDSLVFVWSLWWVKKALLDSTLSVFYTDYLYYPVGVSLAFHTLTLFNSVLSIPLQTLVGVVGAYNVLILLGFAVGGWGAYLLAWEITRNRVASVFAGIIFAFSPYHFANAMADLNVASIQFIPFTLLFLLRWHRNGRYRDPVLSGIFLGLTALCCWYYFLFSCMAAVLFAAVWMLRSRHRQISHGTALGLALFVAVTLAVVSPAAVPMVKAAAEEAEFQNPGRQEAYSADLLSYVIPSPFQTLLSARLLPYYERLPGNVIENTVTPGFVVIFLAAYAAWGRHKLRDENRLIWLVLALAAFVLSLGPSLQLGGRSLGNSGYLPYRWLIQTIPVVSHARIPSRFAMLVICAGSVLAACGFRDLLERPRIRKSQLRRAALGLLLFMLLLFEFWVPVFPTASFPVPEFFTDLARDEEDCAILGLPMTGWNSAVHAMYYQTAHGKRILNGCVSRLPVGADAVFEEWKKDPLSHDFMVRNRVRYIVAFPVDEAHVVWRQNVIDALSGRPWLDPLDLGDSPVTAYRVHWPDDKPAASGDEP